MAADLLVLGLPPNPSGSRFIAPLAILMGEAATPGQTPHAPLIQARFADRVLGCAVGLVGGVCLHSPRFREVAGHQMRRSIQARLGRRASR
jgi:uncharacterized membrane protein YccC